jgi:hypothetical protein
VGIATAVCNGYIVPNHWPYAGLNVMVTSLSLPAPSKNCDGSIVPVTCPPKKWNGYIVLVTILSKKFLTHPSFSLLSPPNKMKRLHCYYYLAFERSNGYMALVTNIKLKLLHRSCFLAPKKFVGFLKKEQLNPQLQCLKILCGSGSLAPCICPK